MCGTAQTPDFAEPIPVNCKDPPAAPGARRLGTTVHRGTQMLARLLKQTVASFIVLCTIAPVGFSAHAVELCGLLSEITEEEANDSPQFRILREFDGRAFLDMETCLVWRLDPVSEPLTLSDATLHCAIEGQGGPYGRMGWQLPTQAQLTSLDTEQWEKQRDTFEKYKLPAAVRTEIDLWSITPWPSEPDSWAVVQFSARTTVVHPIKQDMKAGAWCVRGSPAHGLR